MGYMHIDNLYKNQDILTQKEVWTTEKIHGTSAHIGLSYENGFKPFSGGEKHENFVKLFDGDKLMEIFKAKFPEGTKVIIFGEAYGGKQQGMSLTYGPELKFVAFDVRINETWLNVPDAAVLASEFGIEFVSYKKTTTDLEALNAERDADSTQAIRNGMGKGHKREGIVIRPLIELTTSNGKRLMAKHKRDEFRETKTPRIVSEEKLKVIADAKKAAEEWVTAERLRHVLDKIPKPHDITTTGTVIKAMIEDIEREAEGEIIPSKTLWKEISTKSAVMYKQMIKNENPLC